MTLEKGIHYVGVNDYEIKLFEGQYLVPNGMAYNSYVIADEKTAVMDSVDKHFAAEWLANIKKLLGDKKPDYIVIQHMEPDHSASLTDFLREYPETAVVANAKAFAMIDNFFGKGICKNTLVINDGDTLSLGERELKFIFAPMVHWPEVTVTYDDKDKTLFSADGFGKFGTLDTDEDWACEARRYYFGIVGKYGAQVQALLKKAAALDIGTICPLHGPILSENLGYYLNLYDIWSSYRAESEGVFIAYTSVYGNTAAAAKELKALLESKGCRVSSADLAREDMAEAVEDAFRYDRIVLATTTYNADIFPFMRTFIEALTERGFRNRTVGIIENGSWAPTAARVIRGMLEKSKDLKFAETTVQIKSALNAESRAQLAALADELAI